MATTFKATAEVEGWKEQVCLGCGCTFRYRLKQTQTAKGPAERAAERAAHEAAMMALEKGVSLQPCPTCGMYQPDMLGDNETTVHAGCAIFLAVALGVLVTLVALANFDVIHFLPLNQVLWIATGLCGLVAVMYIWSALHNLNGNLEANRKKAQEAIEAKTLKIEKPGEPGDPLPDARPLPLRFAHRVAFVLLFVGVGTVASAEVVRLANGWPLNRDCEPLVVGAGDQPCVYCPQEISSLKGLWNGRATVKLVNAKELGLADAPLPAECNHDQWGKMIWGKRLHSQNIRPWVRVSVPEARGLSDQVARLDVKMEVNYPASDGRRFHDESQSFEFPAELHLASPFAGRTYQWLWWGAGAAGVLLVLLMGFWLSRLAHASKRQALPSKLLLTDDDVVMNALPVD